MSCPKTPHLLKEYFSDNLSVIAREEIEAHVASCDDCRGELVDLLHTRDVLKSLGLKNLKLNNKPLTHGQFC